VAALALVLGAAPTLAAEIAADGGSEAWVDPFVFNGGLAAGHAAVAFDYAVALGGHAYAGGQWSVALGSGSHSLGDYGVALGADAGANARGATAIGSDATADATDSTAVGTASAAFGERSTALGASSMAVAEEGTALGYQSVAADANATAVGANANAFGVGASAFGSHANTTGDFATAGGYGAVAGSQGTAYGSGAQAIGEGSVALGYGSVALRSDTVSVGTVGSERQITNMAAGTEATDAVNLAQLDAAVADVNGALADLNAVSYADVSRNRVSFAGNGGTVLANVAAGAIDAGSLEAINGGQLYAFGNRVATSLGGGASFGESGLSAPAFYIQGSVYNDIGSALSALDGSLTGVIRRIDIQSDSTQLPAGTGDGLAIGINSHANDARDTVVGHGAQAGADGSTLVGNNASASAQATNAVAIGADSVVTAASASAIGQGASATAANSVALGANAVADRANSVSVGSKGHERQVTNVAAGTATTDAANVGQLNDALATAKAYADMGDAQTLNASKKYTDSRMSNAVGVDDFNAFRGSVDRRFQRVDQRMDRLGAMSAANTQMAINAAGASGRGRVAAGAGVQNGRGALSVGYATSIGERARFSLGGAFSGSENSAGIGFGVDL
jgi:autotransporter adhesin